jgi:sigma-E factor negative regulatory protein RseA
MKEERQNERDSQLSAMFDGELSAAECELLARRLTRDEMLRSQWTRFALIGAALRAERGVALDDRLARRLQAAVAQEASYGDGSVDVAAVVRSTAVVRSGTNARVTAYERWLRFARPVAGVGIAAGVAALSILWLRGQDSPDASLLAANPVPDSVVLAPESVGATVAVDSSPASSFPVSSEPENYSTPAPSSQTSIAPPARLANYVVAHSEYSGPLSRRLALLGLVAGEGSGEGAGDGLPANEPDAAAVTGAGDGR